MSLLHYIEYGFVKLISKYVKNKSVEACYKMGEKLGGIVYRLDKKHREIARTNLTRSFGREKSADEVEKIVKQNFVNIANLGIEFFKMSDIDKNFIDKNITIEGLNNLEESLKAGKGVILITGHFGNWELMGAIFTKLGFKINVIAQGQSNRMVSDLIFSQREKNNINLIRRKEANRKSIEVLRKNEVMVFLADQDARDNGIFVNFFGWPASTARGPAVFQRKMDSPAIMSFLVREKPGKFKLIIEKPFNFTKTENKEKDVLYNTMIWSNMLEHYVRRYPEQWFWVHRRWKTQKGQA